MIRKWFGVLALVLVAKRIFNSLQLRPRPRVNVHSDSTGKRNLWVFYHPALTTYWRSSAASSLGNVHPSAGDEGYYESGDLDLEYSADDDRRRKRTRDGNGRGVREHFNFRHGKYQQEFRRNLEFRGSGNRLHDGQRGLLYGI